MQQGGLRALRHLAPGRLLLPHTWLGCFLFSSRSFSFLATEGPSFSMCSSFLFLFVCSIKTGTRPSPFEKTLRRVQPAPFNPFASDYACAPREDFCGLSAATKIQFLYSEIVLQEPFSTFILITAKRSFFALN